MNKYAKMRRTNAIIKKKLKEMGFYDIVMFPHTRHFKDVFHLWDGVCKYKKEFSDNHFDLAWLQMKTGYAPEKDKQKMERFCSLSGSKGVIAEYIPYKEKYKKKKGSYIKHKIKITKIGF